VWPTSKASGRQAAVLMNFVFPAPVTPNTAMRMGWLAAAVGTELLYLGTLLVPAAL
jgi:hypothetical protein